MGEGLMPPYDASVMLGRVLADASVPFQTQPASNTTLLVKERLSAFPTPLAANLTALALNPVMRERAEQMFDEMWTRARAVTRANLLETGAPEVIIGSGYHAATYAATRVLMGYPRPYVIERSSRAGGVFAISPQPTFYLNSRNRPGGPGLSGDLGASLNHLPGAPIQASNLGNAEFQTNADMAFIIRLTLAQFANVLIDTQVVDVNMSANEIETADGDFFRAGRIIDARGLGDPVASDKANGKTILTFPQLMQRMTQPWPLKGLRRVAVLGDGDSARCAVEALLGIGPESMMAPASLDTVDRIDWYGYRLPATCKAWKKTERSRYQRIGFFLRRDQFGVRRVNIIPRRVVPMPLPDDRVYIEGQTYDLVVLATGNRMTPISGLDDRTFRNFYGTGDYVADYPLGLTFDGRVYRIGPCANLPFDYAETANGISAIPNNKAAMFRLGPKTSALAASLPRAEMPSF